MMSIGSLVPVYPALALAVGGLILLMVGVYSRRHNPTALVGGLAVALLLAVAAGIAFFEPVGRVVILHGQFIFDPFAAFIQVLALGASALTLVLSLSWLQQERIEQFEFVVIMVFAALGIILMVSANDLMSLYLTIELQSLAAYVMAAFKRDSDKSTEAGLKYFVLASVSSGMLLYGASLVYGFAGSTNFDAIHAALSEHVPTGAVVGLVFMMAGLAFKVSAAPFHMWTPDVYEGAPTPVTAFFAVAPKIAAVALFLRVVLGPFGDAGVAWHQIAWLISVASMLVGAFGAIVQHNIKRLMAYSSIGHMGYALVGLAVGTAEGVRGVLVYLALYVFMNVGAFAVILAMRQRGRAVEGIADLAGLAKSNPFLAVTMTIFMFSMAGIPPLAGFFSKLYIFKAAIDQGFIWLSVIGVVSSVVSAYYYIRIIKIMWFDEATDSFDAVTPTNTIVLWGTGAVTLLYIFLPAPLIAAAEIAAKALLAGG